MPVNAIHIGLPKTATTYIQNCWAAEPSVGLSFNGLLPWITWARGMAEGVEAPEPQINIDHRATSGSHLVLTNEALTMHSLNKGASESTCRSYISHVAETLGKKKLTNKIIITIRNPIPWIHSLYGQSVKQGNDETFAEFLNDQAAVLWCSLDLQNLYETYRKHFSHAPLIVSTEELASDPSRFWNRISQYCRLPAPSTEAMERAQSMRNERLSTAGVSLARQLNRQCRLIHDSINKHQPSDEMAELVRRNRETATMLFRKTTEGVPDETIYRVAEDTNTPIQEADTKGTIPDDLLTHIKHQFIDWLSANELLESSILDRYRNSLTSARTD